MKNKEAGNKKGKSIDIVKTKKEATFLIITGLVFFVGFLLFFIFFYRPFVPWKKIVCEKEIRPNITENAGTCIFDEDIKEVTYFYEFNGIKYKKVFDMRAIPYQKWPNRSVAYTIYINVKDPIDVKPGNRGGIDIIIFFIVFIIWGGYMIGCGIYKFHLIKISKEKLK